MPPLDRASHARALLEWTAAGLCHLGHGLEQLAPRVRHEARAGGVQPPSILQLVVGLPAEVTDARCGERHGASPRPLGPSQLRRDRRIAAANATYARPSTMRKSRSAALPKTFSAA